MRKVIAAICVILIVMFAQGAVAETAFSGPGFAMILPDEWTVADSAILSQIAYVLPEVAQNKAALAFNDENAALCVFARPSEGMTIEFMELFQSAYINRIKEALPFCEVVDIMTGSAVFGTNNCFYISFTALETPVWVLYHFSGDLVLTVCVAGVLPEDITPIMAALSAVPETFVPEQPAAR